MLKQLSLNTTEGNSTRNNIFLFNVEGVIFNVPPKMIDKCSIYLFMSNALARVSIHLNSQEITIFCTAEIIRCKKKSYECF